MFILLLLFILIPFVFLYIINYFSYYSLYIKAKRKGIDGLIPIYNEVCKLSIVNISNYYIFIYLIPIVGMIFYMYVNYLFAKKFTNDELFCILTSLLPILIFPIIAYSKNYKYIEGE